VVRGNRIGCFGLLVGVEIQPIMEVRGRRNWLDVENGDAAVEKVNLKM
jgi:hypothetical protein